MDPEIKVCIKTKESEELGHDNSENKILKLLDEKEQMR